MLAAVCGGVRVAAAAASLRGGVSGVCGERAVLLASARRLYPTAASEAASATEASATAGAAAAADAAAGTASADAKAAEDPVAVLKAELESKNAALEEMRNKYLMALADQENTRKIAQREVQNARDFGVGEFAKDILGCADNLDRALSAVPEEKRTDASVRSLYDGVGLTRKQLAGVMSKFGINKVESMGKQFDPKVHNVLAQLDSPGAEPGTIIAVQREGYTIKDRLLRAAEVCVARVPE